METTNRTLRHRLDSLPTWALIALCLLYCVCPIDLIPFFPFDDLGVFAWTAWTVAKRLKGPASPMPELDD